MRSAPRCDSAKIVNVGFDAPAVGKMPGPATQRLGISWLCPKLSTTESAALLPMMVPPIRWLVGIEPRDDHASLAPAALATFNPSSRLAFHSATASAS